MPGSQSNPSLQASIDALKQAASKNKQTDAVEVALGQLDSVPKLVVSHSMAS
jgi:hypothetical protein